MLPLCSIQAPSSHLKVADPFGDVPLSVAVDVWPLVVAETDPEHAKPPTLQSRLPASQPALAFMHSRESAPPLIPSQRHLW